MASKNIVMKIRVAWWLKWYCLGVVAMCRLTGKQPDEDRVKFWVSRAVSAKVATKDV